MLVYARTVLLVGRDPDFRASLYFSLLGLTVTLALWRLANSEVAQWAWLIQ